MIRQDIIRTPAVNRRQSFLSTQPMAAPDTAVAPVMRGRTRFSEEAGRSAAECTLICCCCPCTVMSIIVLAIYKVPAGLCKKASRRKRQRAVAKMRAGTVGTPGGRVMGTNNSDGTEVDYTTDSVADLLKKGDVDGGGDDFDREMRDRFHGGGFWRSPSRES
ncbi:hypothetical protein SAY86_017296 [Trapa natans]|uniref:Uncharacterized protein n=1 Tax=Trapa natans TaxID=22666 RepID=A0AAN7R4Z3_TRANT|nr:hypothetical protein SAY86_017296 [Trapa natans]